MIKLLIVGPFPNPITGVSLANQTFVDYLKSRNIPFDIIDTNSRIGLSSKQGNTFSMAKALEFIKTYLKIFKVFSHDVLYITPGQTFYGVFKYMPFIFFSRILGKPYIIHLHGNYLGREYEALQGIKKKFFKYLISGASKGIVLSKSLRKNFESLLKEKNVEVVENFVNEELYEIKPEHKKFDTLDILYLSNLMVEKGILDVLDALLILKSKGIPFQASIAGELEKKIESEVNSKLKMLQPEVIYIDVVKGAAKINALKKANIFILPTYYKMEGQPIAILEAMATGNMIVTTRHAGIPDIVDEENALFVEVRNPADIAEKLEIIAKDLNMIEAYSSRNLHYARSRFTEEAFGAKLIEILRNARA